MTITFERAAAHRIACAVVAAEVACLRGTPLPTPHHWSEHVPIGDDGLGLDSLEKLGALGALAETFELGDAILGRESPRTVGAWIDLILQQHSSGEGWITVMTSGSAGRPRPCRHRVSDLIEEARTLAEHMPKRSRVVAMVPAHHLYGIIWTAILPDILGVPVVSRSIGAALDLVAGDLVVAVPEQWRAIQRFLRSFPIDVVGVSSAGALDDACATDLLDAGLTQMFDIYGSSETGGVAIRKLPETDYQLLPRWNLGQDEAGGWQLEDADGQYHQLPDHIDRLAERSLRLAGRRDQAVQVGGHNVWPARVEDVLRAIEGVADVTVRLHTGGRLKAFIVPEIDADAVALAPVIERVAVNLLSAPERPRSVQFGDALPRNTMGKLEDWS
ncbi:AMP-binding protein [Sphingomonas sp. SAFR-052]|uniref:AMP-binding protein n=1 Tax=Sphingomonas sp. SAFR-052 TaxID=3436867 RepID=UPI003F7D0C04